MVVLLHYVNPQLVINVDYLRNIYRHIAHPIYKMSQLKNEKFSVKYKSSNTKNACYNLEIDFQLHFESLNIGMECFFFFNLG